MKKDSTENAAQIDYHAGVNNKFKKFDEQKFYRINNTSHSSRHKDDSNPDIGLLLNCQIPIQSTPDSFQLCILHKLNSLGPSFSGPALSDDPQNPMCTQWLID